MTPPSADRTDSATKRRVRDAILQLIGFGLGILFIIWCFRRAFSGDGFASVAEHVRAAPTWLIVAALLSTLVSVVANGLIFWCTIQPVRPLRLVDVQAVNLLASLLNYAPFRIGLVARIAFHWRVDRIGPALMTAWLITALLSLCVAFVAVALAMPLAPRIGLPGVFLVITATCIVATWLVRKGVAIESIRARLRGAHAMLGEVRSFGLAVALRVVDIVAFTARMTCVAAILNSPLTVGQAAMLGLAAFALTMNPIGRFGFREAGVAWLASNVFKGTLSEQDLGQAFAQLALVDSAAEAAVTIPLGALAALWCWRRTQRGDQARASSVTTSGAEAPPK